MSFTGYTVARYVSSFANDIALTALVNAFWRNGSVYEKLSSVVPSVNMALLGASVISSLANYHIV